MARQSPDAKRSAGLLRELVAIHARFPTLFEEQRSGMVLFDTEGNLVSANRAALTFLGVTVEDLAPRRYGAFIERTRRDEARTAFSRAAAGNIVETVTRVTVAGGEHVDIRMTLMPAIAEGTIVGVYGSAGLIGYGEGTARKIQEFLGLFAHHSDAVLALDTAGYCIEVNPACERLTGYDASELRGRSYLSLVASDERFSARKTFARVLRGEPTRADTVVLHRDGGRIELAGTCVPIVVDGIVAGAYLIGSDVTEQRRLEAAEREQTERLRTLYLLAASTSQSAEGQIVSALELGCRLLNCDAGYVSRIDDGSVRYLYAAGQTRRGACSMEPAEDSLHRFIFETPQPVSFDDFHVGQVRSMIGARIAIGGIDFGTLSLVSATAREQPFTEADRDFVGLMAALVASAIERSEQRQRADLLAFYDPSTQLPNRTLLSDRLMQAISSAERHPSEFAVHFYDLDGFKAINDAHGHMRGDDVLRIVARRFERAARQEDTVARIGGDEFVVLQPAVHSRADVEALSHRLTAALSEPLVVSGVEYRLTASGGIAMFPADGNDPRTLLAVADAALYRVKQSGRNGIAFVSQQS